MNQQKPQSQSSANEDGSIVVHSIFRTIQGEGPFSGYPAVFVRLSGCNLDCPLCDTEYTDKAVTYSLKRLKDEVASLLPSTQKGGLIVITGGEPFRQHIGPAVRKLLAHGYKVQIETNGTLYVPGPWEDPSVTIVVSPKVPKVNLQIASYARAYKYVACASDIADDGLPTSILGRWDGGMRVARPPVNFTGKVYLQPADVKDPVLNKANQDAVVQSCLRHGHILCLQLHKIVGVD